MFCRIARQQDPRQFRVGCNYGKYIVVFGNPDIGIQCTCALSFNFVADILHAGFQFLHNRIAFLHSLGWVFLCPLKRHTRYISKDLPEPVQAIGVIEGIVMFGRVGREAAEDEGAKGGEVAVPGRVGFGLPEWFQYSIFIDFGKEGSGLMQIYLALEDLL